MENTTSSLDATAKIATRLRAWVLTYLMGEKGGGGGHRFIDPDRGRDSCLHSTWIAVVSFHVSHRTSLRNLRYTMMQLKELRL